MDHKAILNAIADYKIIAARLGVAASSVSRWKSEGIPVAYWIPISRMARAKHLRGITLDLIELTSPARGRKEREPDPVS